MHNNLETEEIILYSKKLNILYVEDDKDTRESTNIMLNILFENVTVAVDGLDGLKSYKKQYEENNEFFDLVISDIEMPNLDGISMVKSIYEINPLQKVFIISAYSTTNYLVSLISIGIDSFISKPLLIDELNKELLRTY